MMYNYKNIEDGQILFFGIVRVMKKVLAGIIIGLNISTKVEKMIAEISLLIN